MVKFLVRRCLLNSFGVSVGSALVLCSLKETTQAVLVALSTPRDNKRKRLVNGRSWTVYGWCSVSER